MGGFGDFWTPVFIKKYFLKETTLKKYFWLKMGGEKTPKPPVDIAA